MSTCSARISNSYATSKWSGTTTPIPYYVETDKFPVNTVDTIDAFGAVLDTFGYAQIELSGSYETYLKGEFIRITGASVAAYNGVWRVREVADVNSIVISAPFAGTATGSMQRYYNNMYFETRLYIGIPTGHPYNAERPMELKPYTIKTQVSPAGVTEINVNPFVDADLGIIDNRLCETIESGEWISNDWSLWTAYRAEIREFWDGVDADGNLITVYSDWSDLGTETYYAIKGAQQFQASQGVNFGAYSMEPNVFEVPAKFLSTFDQPTYFLGSEYDIAIIMPETDADRYGVTHFATLKQFDGLGIEIADDTYTVPLLGEGVYRFAFSELQINPDTRKMELFIQRVELPSTVRVTETKTILVQPEACRDGMYLRWISPLGNWEGWRFDGYVQKGIAVDEVVETRRNVWADFDNTFAAGNTIDDRIKRGGKETRVVHAAFLNDDQSNGMKWLRMSIKVQEIYFTDEGGCDGYKRRTWLPENASFTYLDPADRVRSFRLQLTDTAPLFIQGQ